MLSGAEVALAAAALLIGLTGTWSPCGFSMIDTIGPAGHTGGRRTALAASATFVPGAVAGGIVTFGALAALGGLAHGAGQPAYLVAAAIALLAAVAEARGVPIVPQIRRQLPEHWRRTLPMPLASALYGGLLGLGFTTFVLSFGVWALAGISFAVGEVGAGVTIGAAFGLGRAIPIAALAPISDTRAGIRVAELMAERPAIYRGARIGDALALVIAAAALATGTATAANPEASPGADPSAEPGELAHQLEDRSGVLRRGGASVPLPGTDPAIGGPYAAVIVGERIDILDRGTLARVGEIGARGADAVALSGEWLVYRARRDGADSLWAHRIADPRAPSEAIRLAAVGGPAQLGRPSVNLGTVAYAIANRRVNRIVLRKLPRGKARNVLRSRRASLSNPTIRGKQVLYVEGRRKRQRLRVKTLGRKGAGRALMTRKGRRPLMWSTALAGDRAYVTLLRGGSSRIVSVGR